MYRDRNLATQLVRRAERAGFKAIVLTADCPLIGHREANIKNRLAIIYKCQQEQSFTKVGTGFHGRIDKS